MTTATITNKTIHPFDIYTLTGMAILPANGEFTGDFDPAYLEILELSHAVEVGGVEEREEKAEEFVEEKQEEVVIEEEIKKEEAAESDPVDLHAEYKELSGKDADKRWSDKRLAEEIAKLKD